MLFLQLYPDYSWKKIAYTYICKSPLQVVAATLNNRQETGENRGDFLDLMIESRKISDETNPGNRKHGM